MHKKDPSGQGFLCNMQSIHREKTKTAPQKCAVLFWLGYRDSDSRGTKPLGRRGSDSLVKGCHSLPLRSNPNFMRENKNSTPKKVLFCFVSRHRKRYQPKILMIQGISVLFDAFLETFTEFSPKQRDFSVNQKRYPTFLGAICSICASENSVLWWSENGDTRRVISRRRFSKCQASTGEVLFSA